MCERYKRMVAEENTDSVATLNKIELSAIIAKMYFNVKHSCVLGHTLHKGKHKKKGSDSETISGALDIGEAQVTGNISEHRHRVGDASQPRKYRGPGEKIIKPAQQLKRQSGWLAQCCNEATRQTSFPVIAAKSSILLPGGKGYPPVITFFRSES